MKTKFLISISAILIAQLSHAQPWANAWKKGGNPLGSFGVTTIGTNNTWNAPFQLITNGNIRMHINNGATGTLDGRVGIGNNLPSTFVPRSRVHLHENATTGYTGLRFTNTTTGSGFTDGYQIRVNNFSRQINHVQHESAAFTYRSPDFFGTLTEWFRIHNGNNQQTTSSIYSATGYIGLNDSTPDFHIDAVTPRLNMNTELFLSFRPSDVPNSRVGFLNPTGVNFRFNPTVFGFLDASQPGAAFQTFANIDPTQDLTIASTPIPVQKFIVGKGYDFLDVDIADLSEISNRNAFGWNNGAKTNMLMNAAGMLKIQNDLSLSTAIQATLEVRDVTGAFSNINTLIYSNHTNGFSVGLAVQNLSPLPNRIAGYFEASGVSKAHAIVVPDGGGNVGFGTTNPNTGYRLEVFGFSNFNGNIDGFGTFNYMSDINFKNDIDTLHNALSIINALQPSKFYFDTTNSVGLIFDNRLQYGFIAQEVENTLPELVQNKTREAVLDSLGNTIYPSFNFKTLNYNAFIAILTKGIQEQQRTLDSMKMEMENKDSALRVLSARISAIESCLTNTGICNTPNALSPNTQPNAIGSNIARQQIELKDMERVVLDQNVPNPFAEQTIINYYLPQNVQRAQMLFYDHNGRLINTFDLNGTGAGQLQVFANDLSNGIYQYVLVVDGEIMESKKMVKMD